MLGEPRDGDWRGMFWPRFQHVVASAGSLTEAAQALNANLWATWQPPLRFVADQTPAIMSPFEVITHGYGTALPVPKSLVFWVTCVQHGWPWQWPLGGIWPSLAL